MVKRTFRPKAVCELFGFSKSTLHDQINKGKFPPPNVQIGDRAVGWTEDLLEEEQAKRIAARAAKMGAA